MLSLREFCVFWPIYFRWKEALLLGKKVWITLEGNIDSILNFEIKEFKKPSILASLFMVFEVMFEISIPFVMASLLDQRCSTRNMNNILFYSGLMLVCLSPSFVGCSRPVMAPMHRLVLPKTFVGPFSKGSNLLIWKYWSVLIRWVSHSGWWRT